ncbi:helix-turn-helix transcriptional regulator [Vagococcus coleopterorum]|uniref:Helix-turn-helix transcriptional regulator n=1 Tax=Vagococcus coleopterorum TaxID=2714946 RepID=A0A6G8ALN2_9ENTE|nr:CBS domain-containing protein [Vagococcus coleopterorum]QIL45869.1 helix-turn-helix transcriptional regulator [Vagococcus coleopterorum]
MKLTARQEEIIKIVKKEQPISGDKIAASLGLTKPTLRSDLAVLTMTGILDAKPKVGYFFSGSRVEPLLFETVYNQRVKDIMAPAICLPQTTTVADCITNLFMYDVGTLYIVEKDSKQLTGVVSRKDLLRSLLNKGDQTLPVAVIMSRMPNIVRVTPEQTILDVADLLIKSQVDSLPVIESQTSHKVVGKITKTLLTEHFVSEGHKAKGYSE